MRQQLLRLEYIASFCFISTHSIPEHDVHTKLPTVMSVYVTPGWLHSKQCLFTPDWASSRTLRAQTSWLSRCLRFDILQPPPAAPPAAVSPVPVNRDPCRNLPSSATWSTTRPALCKTRWCGFSLSVRSNGEGDASS